MIWPGKCLTTLPLGGDHERLRQPAQAPLAVHRAGVVDDGEIQPVSLRERAGVADVVLAVDADDVELTAVAVRELRQHRRLVLARAAPRRPEVQHHRLAAGGRERERAAVQRVQREVRRRRPLAVAQLGRHRRGAGQHALQEHADQQGEQGDDDDLEHSFASCGSASGPSVGGVADDHLVGHPLDRRAVVGQRVAARRHRLAWSSADAATPVSCGGAPSSRSRELVRARRARGSRRRSC